MMIRIAALVLLGVASVHAEAKTFEFDFEDWAEGQPREEAFVVDGKFAVATKDGGKALVAEVGELVEACVLLGDSAKGSASIQARVFSSRKGRSLPRYSIGVHGQSGYRLVVAPAKKELQLTKGEEVVKAVPLDWPNEAWFNVKLEVTKVEEKRWSVVAKAWPQDKEEPVSAQIEHEDATLRGQGKCSLWATPYSGTPIYFDDVKIAVAVE
jgi:hypothetical protein